MAQVIALCVLSLLLAVNAHTDITSIVIGGQVYTTCMKPTYPGYSSATGIGSQWPIMSSDLFPNGLGSTNYTCGFMPYAGNPAQSKCTVAAGGRVGISFYHGAGYGNEDPILDKWIARSHKGPFLAYMAKSETGTGNVWFKIYQEGITQMSNNFDNIKWASPDTMLANNGVIYFNIPGDITPGNYLLRAEIIALHDTSPRGAQPYVRCVELTVTGGGSANPTGVPIPGAYSYDDPGITFNIYNLPYPATGYPFPGPPVYVPSSNTGAIPCSQNSDCESNICTIDGICYSSSASALVFSVILGLLVLLA